MKLKLWCHITYNDVYQCTLAMHCYTWYTQVGFNGDVVHTGGWYWVWCHSVPSQHIRGFTTTSYINLCFTYLVTYLLTYSPLCCTKRNSWPIKGQCTDHHTALWWSAVVWFNTMVSLP